MSCDCNCSCPGCTCEPTVEKALTEIPGMTAISEVVKADEARKYTLSVAYPAMKKDGHGEFARGDQLEQAAWDWMAKSRTIGLYHADGLVGHGTVVESYIWRADPWDCGDQVIKNGDWLLGVRWGDKAWQLIQTDQVDGLSIQGRARRTRASLAA